jgi:hypothetical protein
MHTLLAAVWPEAELADACATGRELHLNKIAVLREANTCTAVMWAAIFSWFEWMWS